MPKVTIKFDLPEENEEYKITSQAQSMHSVLWKVQMDLLRPMRKYGVPEKFTTVDELFEHIDKQFQQILAEEGVEI